MLGIAASLQKGGASLLTFIKDNLKLYLDFNSKKSDTLKFPSEGSTSFDGNDHISIADSSTLTIADGQGFTASIWFKTSTATEMYLFDNRSGSEGFTAIINAGGTNYLGHIHDGSNALQFTNTENYNDGAWHHFAFTFDGTDTITSYIDGSSVGTGTQALGEVNGGNLLIGKPTASDTKYWNGSLTNFAIWSRELSPEEIQSIQNKSYSQLKGVEKTPSLVSWWALDSASNGVVQPHDGESTTLISNRDFAGVADGTDPTTLSYIFAYGTPGEKTIDNERLKIVDSNNTGVYWKETGLTSSKLYKITVEATGDVASGGVYSSDLSFTLSNGTFTGYVTGKTQIIVYLRANNNSAGTTFYDNLKTEEVTSNTGYVTGATTTTSVYGGNAPILPRAVDVAKEGQADVIGNGSALFNGSTDLIQVNANSNIDNLFQAGGTFTAWVNVDSAGEDSNGRVTEKSFLIYTTLPSGSTCKLGLHVPFSSTAGGWLTTNHNINFDEWQHIAITYNGSSTSNNPIIYINGISVAVTENSTPAGTISADTATLYIGNNSATTRSFDGEMAQVGIWRGALTQAQVQEVLESTSYSKIPADVKSTLGNELVDNLNTSGFADNGDGSTISNITNGVSIADDSGASDMAWFRDSYLLSSDLTVGKLYKVQFNAYRNSSGTPQIRVRDGASNTDISITETDTTYTHYMVAQHATDASIRSTNNSSGSIVYLTNLSLKEVTNDIVAYYPLDGDSSANGVTQDVTTGETLGSNTFGGLNQFAPKVVDRESVSVSGDELTLTIPSANDGGMNTGNLANLGLSTLLGYAVGDLAKLEFQAKSVSVGSGNGLTLRVYDVNGYVFSATNISLTSEYQTFTIYGEISNLGYSIPSILRMGNQTGTDVYKFKNFSVQKVTSNTGVLK